MNPHSVPSPGKRPDIASASVSDALAALSVNAETGLTRAEVGARWKEHGYNEVAEQKGHPLLKFLGKFWGMSAWMLELIMVLSAVLRKYSDLAVVSALLVVNAVLSFAQEHRAAGVVETLRRRLQISARVLRDARWQVNPASTATDVAKGAAMVSCLVVNDAVKVAMIKRLVPAAVAYASGRQRSQKTTGEKGCIDKEHSEPTGRERKENERQQKSYRRSNERQPCLF